MDVDGLIGAQAIESDGTGTKTVPSARDHARHVTYLTPKSALTFA